MGSIVSSHMAETFRKNQENMKEMNRKNMEKQMALQIARSRDLFMYISSFYAITAFGLLNGFRKTKKPALLAPLLPLTFVTGYWWDMAYGDKIIRIRREAEHVLVEEKDLLKLPQTED